MARATLDELRREGLEVEILEGVDDARAAV